MLTILWSRARGRVISRRWVLLGICRAVWAKTVEKGAIPRRKRPVIRPSLTVTGTSSLQGEDYIRLN